MTANYYQTGGLRCWNAQNNYSTVCKPDHWRATVVPTLTGEGTDDQNKIVGSRMENSDDRDWWWHWWLTGCCLPAWQTCWPLRLTDGGCYSDFLFSCSVDDCCFWWWWLNYWPDGSMRPTCLCFELFVAWYTIVSDRLEVMAMQPSVAHQVQTIETIWCHEGKWWCIDLDGVSDEHAEGKWLEGIVNDER